MRKKNSNLREYEKNNRVINIPKAQEERRSRLEEQKEYQKKRQKKRVKVNYGRVIIIVIVICLLAYFGVYAVKIMKLDKERDAVNAENKKLEQSKARLELTLENINTPDYIEEQAREELKLIKPNELLFIFPDSTDTDDEDSSDNSKDSSK